MGIHDREYYRREGPRYLDALTFKGQVCKWLILSNVAVFVLQIITQNAGSFSLTELLALEPQRVLGGEIWRLLTYAFLHDPHNIWHIVVNMWLLFMFGGDLEERFGNWEFLAFYLTAAVAGGLAFLGQALVGWQVQMHSVCLGASGAVMAVMILCALLYPNRTILLFFVLPVPIWILAVLYVLQDTLGLLGGSGENVAFGVHLAGAGFALLYQQANWRITNVWHSLQDWKVQRSRPRLRVYRGEDSSREPVAVAAPPPQFDLDEHLEAKVDAVLEKVTRYGQASLTEDEKKILLRASEIYKKRRS